MSRQALATMVLLLACSAGSAPGSELGRAASLDAAVTEAAATFRVPEPWIRAVIAAESGGDPQAVSRAGAMGLMQLMPGTWRELRLRLGLGPDPHDVRDNVLAGTAYLREMFDRFGAPGFLAAYNAGPARYAAHLEGRLRLPGESLRYVARLAPVVGAAPTAAARPDWRDAPLFPPAQGRGPAIFLTAGDAHEGDGALRASDEP
jgi:soluble lytic murein transglycosylase-like protein